MEPIVKKLRNKKNVTVIRGSLFERLYYRIQLNKSEKRICWQRFVSKDRGNWIKLNDCLSLKEVVSFLNI